MANAGTDDDSLGVQFLRAKVRKVRVDADAAELRNAEREGRLCDVGLVSKCLELLCSRARSTGELARRKWGDEGYNVFSEMVDGFGSDLREFVDAERTARTNANGASKPESAVVVKRSKPETTNPA